MSFYGIDHENPLFDNGAPKTKYMAGFTDSVVASSSSTVGNVYYNSEYSNVSITGTNQYVTLSDPTNGLTNVRVGTVKIIRVTSVSNGGTAILQASSKTSIKQNNVQVVCNLTTVGQIVKLVYMGTNQGWILLDYINSVDGTIPNGFITKL
jgi:hypothetical protein